MWLGNMLLESMLLGTMLADVFTYLYYGVMQPVASIIKVG
jgi:hypothetical protein